MIEELHDVVVLIGFLHHALYSSVAQHMVAVQIYLVNLDFLVLIHYDVDNRLVLLAQVLALAHIYCGFVKTLSCKEILSHLLDSAN